MKKVLLILACVFGMSTAALALTSSAVLLQHNGNITTYALEDIAQAMADAADGDEVFLNDGKYPGFTISKAIKIKGAGQKTFIDGNIVIENTEKNLGDIFIGFLYLDGSLRSKTVMGKLDLMQLKVTGGFVCSDGTVDEMFVDRCKIGGDNYIINLGSNYEETVTVRDVTTTTIHPRVKKFTAMNSKISIRQSTNTFLAYPPYTFINCDVLFPASVTNPLTSYGLTFINSFVHQTMYHKLSDSEFINCVYDSLNDTNKLTGCYQTSSIKDSWTIYNLEDMGYFGNDGTVIGPLGGTRNTPFTLEPVVPRVTESTLKVDPTNKKLDVTVTVSPK